MSSWLKSKAVGGWLGLAGRTSGSSKRGHEPFGRRLRLEPLEARRLLAVLPVTNVNDSGAGSLRAAVVAANSTTEKDDIVFAIPGTGVHTIQLQTLLPTVTQPISIDGFTQSGSHANTSLPGQANNALQTIVLDGSLLLGYNFPSALTLTGGNSTVRGLSVQKFRGVGIVFKTLGGNVAVGNLVKNTGGGISAQNGSDGNRIGGLAPADQNVGGTVGVSSNNNVVQGNITNGIGVAGSNNTIGGTTASARNVASGNLKYGINISGSNNRVLGNYVGVDVTGVNKLRSGTAGVFITGNNNTIGGSDAGARNIISGNSRGVYIFGGSSNVVQGNWIGLNAAGTPLGNGLEGVQITNNGANNLIGGTALGAGNVISANRTGVTLFLGAAGNVVQGNLIGTLADGTTAAGNTYAGVLISSTASGNTIGGTAAGAGNVIANTLNTGASGGGTGVLVQAVSSIPAAAGNAILGNSIFANGGLGFDLTPNESTFGVTANDAGDRDSGANGLQNFPVLSSAKSGGGTTTILGTLNSRASSTFRVEFFASATGDASGFGEGARFIGAVNVSTNTSGNASFTATLPAAVAAGQVITATATDASGNTSEFSAVRSVTAAVATATASAPTARSTTPVGSTTASSTAPPATFAAATAPMQTVPQALVADASAPTGSQPATRAKHKARSSAVDLAFEQLGSGWSAA